MSRRLGSRPKVRNRFLVAILSIIPGVGHFYLGQNSKGILLLVPSFFLIPMFITIPLSIIDANIMARRTARGCLLETWEWFWSSSADSDLRFIEFVLIRRTEEFIGKETRAATNQSSEKITRDIELYHEWTFTYTVQREISQRITDVHSIQMRDGANRSRTIEHFFQERYSLQKGEKKSYRETVRVTIPGKKKILLEVLWKNIIEIGSIVLQDSKKNEFVLPYRSVVGITFDLEQSEVSL